MNVYYKPRALKTLDAKLEFINGRGSRKLAVDLAAAVELGNEHDRLAGVDRYGRTIAKLRSKRKGRYAGATGKPLVPFGVASRAIAAFQAVVKGSRPPCRILAGWRDVVSKSGYPFLVAHDEGRGRNPIRAIFGISPNTWQLIRSRIAEFKAGFKKAR